MYLSMALDQTLHLNKKSQYLEKTEQNSLERNKENFQIFKWNNKI